MSIQAIDILRRVKEVIYDIFWPKKCIKCNKIISLGKKEAICRKCEAGVLMNSSVVIEPDRYFEEVNCALPYEDYVRKYMIDYKFHSYKYLSHAFAKAIEKIVEGREFLDTHKIICPVPIHHMRDREYNQSLLIARELSEKFSLELCPDLLIKTKNIKPMSSMGYAKRYASVTGVVDFNLRYDVYGKNVILVDDIYTTGSTADECAKILRMHGCENVIVLTSCYRDPTKGDVYFADAD
ncbi:MAG: ComF family protein [Ruminococcaceae bacterium]|nr:ComF family protein [Oscillospiraceae bacterium]